MSDEQQALIDKAKSSNFMVGLVQLARIYARVGAKGSYTVELPLSASGWIDAKNAYRKVPINHGETYETGDVKIGKRGNLIFSLIPVNRPIHKGVDHPTWIEVSWEDIENSFPHLDEAMCQMLVDQGNPLSITEINKRLKDMITQKKEMHSILQGAFDAAFAEAKQDANAANLEEIEGWGTC